MSQQAMLAGPRRARPTTPPPLPKVIAPTPLAVEVAADEAPTISTSAQQPAAQEITAKVARPISRRLPWFIVGVVLGTLVVVGSSGKFGDSIRGARAHVASSIRSLKHTKTPEAAPASTQAALARTGDVPCTEDDCALLLAPFKAASFADPPGATIPLVDVNDLPKAKPRVVWTPAPQATGDVANTSDPSDDAPPPPAPKPDPKDAPPYESGPVASLPAAP
jgi:hypothetical protein